MRSSRERVSLHFLDELFPLSLTRNKPTFQNMKPSHESFGCRLRECRMMYSSDVPLLTPGQKCWCHLSIVWTAQHCLADIFRSPEANIGPARCTVDQKAGGVPEEHFIILTVTQTLFTHFSMTLTSPPCSEWESYRHQRLTSLMQLIHIRSWLHVTRIVFCSSVRGGTYIGYCLWWQRLI